MCEAMCALACLHAYPETSPTSALSCASQAACTVAQATAVPGRPKLGPLWSLLFGAGYRNELRNARAALGPFLKELERR